AAQRGFVYDQPEPGRVGAGEDLLAGEPQFDPPFGFAAGGGGESGADAGAGVVGGLEQAGDGVRVVAADQAGGFFQADEGAEPGGQDVVVAVPPAGLAGLAGQGQERVDLGGVGDAVGGEQALDGQWFQAAFGAFHPTDGPGGGVDGFGGLFVGEAGS